MKFFPEIAKFLREHTVHQGELLVKASRKPSRSSDLYEQLVKGELTGDEDAAQYYYGERDHRYLKLREQFIKNIVTSVLAIEWKLKGNKKHQHAYYSLVREIAVAKILFRKARVQSAVFFAKRCLKKALKYRFYEFAEDALQILIIHYSTRSIRKREFEAYLKQSKEISAIIELDKKAVEYYGSMQVNGRKLSSDVEGSKTLYQYYYDELSPYLGSCGSFDFQMLTRLIALNIDSLSYDYPAMLSTCSAAINYYLDQSVLHYTGLYIFLIQKTRVCVRIGAFEEGLQTIKQTLELVEEGELNWFPIRYNEFFIYMQSGRYEEAYAVYREVSRHKKYKNLIPIYKEDWVVGEAYLHYLIEIDKLEASNSKNFRLARFLNSVPEYSKDKRVRNIPVLIVQILYLLLRKNNKADIEDRMEAIEKYCARNLRDNPAVRSNAFIQILLQIPKSKYNKQGVLRRIGKFKKRLEEIPIHQSGKAYDLELIPYERLTSYVLAALK